MNKKDKFEDNVENKGLAAEQLDEKNEIEVFREEISTLKDSLLRKAADSENLRKRLEKEKEDAIKYSNSRFAKDLLVVIDNLERATESVDLIKEKIETDSDLKAFFEGILLCERELISVFQKHGISKVEATENDVFDPQYHQAMCELDSPAHTSGSIIKVFQAGYTCNDRLLRPAMVSVSKKT